MKRILSLLLAFVLAASLGLTAYADSYTKSVTVSGVPAPVDGEVPPASVSVSAGTVDSVEWYLADGNEIALADGETFKAGHKYALYVYIDAPSEFPWQPLISGNVIYTDISDVNADARDERGRALEVTGNYLWFGQLMLQMFVECPGPRKDDPAPVPAPEPKPEPTPVKTRPDFSDVPSAAWYYKSVYDAVDLELVNGTGKGDDGRDRFDPDGNMTFAQASKLAACLHQRYTTGAVTLQNGDPWYKSYVDYCAEKGIFAASSANGGITSSDVMNRANEFVTRAEFAWIFARALPAEALPVKNTIPDDSIPDVKSGSGYWASSVYILYRAGILNGSDEKGSFLPETNISRAAVAAICVRMIQSDQRVGAPAKLNG